MGAAYPHPLEFPPSAQTWLLCPRLSQPLPPPGEQVALDRVPSALGGPGAPCTSSLERTGLGRVSSHHQGRAPLCTAPRVCGSLLPRGQRGWAAGGLPVSGLRPRAPGARAGTQSENSNSGSLGCLGTRSADSPPRNLCRPPPGAARGAYLAPACPAGRCGTRCWPTAAAAWRPAWTRPRGTRGPAPSLGASRPRSRPGETRPAASASLFGASQTWPGGRTSRPGRGETRAPRQGGFSADVLSAVQQAGGRTVHGTHVPPFITERRCPASPRQEQADGS